MGAGEVGSTDLRVRLLGPVELTVDGQRVPIGGPGVRGLLALLALRANRVVTVDELIDALWGHDPPNTARTIVHGNVSQLRRVLRSVGGEQASAAILTRAPGYQLAIAAEQVDVHQASALLERAGTAAPAVRGELLAEAYGLWRGPVLSGVPESVHAPELESLRVAVQGARVDADLELGRYAELVPELSALVRENPLAERTVGQLMRALYHGGRRADALEVYRKVARHVVDSLGIDPGPELRALHESVLADNLVSPERAAEPGRVVAAQLPPPAGALTGRDAEFAWLDGLLGGCGEAATVIGVLTGAAGVGKSALLVSWAHRVAARFPDGVLFATLRGFDPDHPPVTPSEVLLQFLVGLGVPAAELPEGTDELVALYRSVMADRSVLVLLDDARTEGQLRELLPSGPRSMALVTSRSRLEGLVVSHGARVRAIATLPPADSVAVLTELAGSSSGGYERLAQLCDYLPLALRITGARLASGPRWRADDLAVELANERTRLSALELTGSDASVRAALDVSYRALTRPVAACFRLLGALTTAAVGPYLVAQVCGIDVVQARRRLRVLVDVHLLTESARDVFAPHDLVRLYLRELGREELSDSERAEALVRAVRYYQAASDTARRCLLRIVDPLDFTDMPDKPGVPDFSGVDAALDWFALEWPNLLAVLEAAYTAGMYTQAWQLARVVHTYRVVRPLHDEWMRLSEIGIAAADASGSELGRCWMLISRCAMALTFDHAESSRADAEAATELADRLGDDRLRVSATIHRGCALTVCGEHDEAIACLQEAVAEASTLADLALHGQALANCAEAQKRAGHYAEAITHQLGSLRVDRQLRDDSYAVVSLTNLAELYLRTTQLTESERYARESVVVSVDRGFTLQEGVSRLALGRTLHAKGEVDEAASQLSLAVALHERVSPQLARDVRAEVARTVGEHRDTLG